MCAVRVIAESEIIQDFLTESEEDISASPLVDLKVDLNKMSEYLHANFMIRKDNIQQSNLNDPFGKFVSLNSFVLEASSSLK